MALKFAKAYKSLHSLASGQHQEDDSKTSQKRTSPDEESSRENMRADTDTMFPFVKSSRAEFEATYFELHKIGEGGFGAVYEGYRMADALPVAIKHIPRNKVRYMEVVHNDKVCEVIEEIALMVKAAGGEETYGKSAAISLLDCFGLEDLILVMERPVPSVDLHRYRSTKGGHLQEAEAKIILRQMVDAAIEMHSNGVLHRDIKMENILIETGCDVPRVRVLDFGCGCLVQDGSYSSYRGNVASAPPECFLMGKYQAGPTTVWQLGALMYDLLDHLYSFDTKTYLMEGIDFNFTLSKGCLDFMQMCLTTDPEMRATLQQLQLHPWLAMG